MNRNRHPLLLAAAAALLCALPLDAAAQLAPGTPVATSIAKSKRPKARFDDLKLTCDTPSGQQSSKCPVIQWGRYRIWAFSYKNNSTQLALVAFNGEQVAGRWNLTGTRYAHTARVDRRARTISFFGQGNRAVTIRWDELDLQRRPTPTPTPTHRGAHIAKLPVGQAPRASSDLKIVCMKGGRRLDRSTTCPVLVRGDTQVWAFSYRNNSSGLALLTVKQGKIIKRTNVRGTRYPHSARLVQSARVVEFIGQADRKAVASVAKLMRANRPTPTPPVTTPPVTTPPVTTPPQDNKPRVIATRQVVLRSHHNKYVLAHPNGSATADQTRVGANEMLTLMTLSNGQVALRSASGKYLVAEADGTANANRGAMNEWERWTLIKHGDGTVSLKSHHNKYLVAEADGKLNANRAKAGPWERFKVLDAARFARPRTVALLSHHGKYVVSEHNGAANANRDRLGSLERWTLIKHHDGTVSLRGSQGKYLVAEADGHANANRAKAGPWERWRMIRHRDGTVSFKSHHGKYLVAEGDGKLNANRAKIGPWERFKLITVR